MKPFSDTRGIRAFFSRAQGGNGLLDGEITQNTWKIQIKVRSINKYG